MKKFGTKRDFARPTTEVAGATSATALAASGGISSCTIDYNQAYVLNTLPDKAWNTFAFSPFYNQTCGGISQKFWLYTLPVADEHYHLGFEDPLVCYDPGTSKRMGRYPSAPTRQPPPNCSWSFPTCNYNSTDPSTLRRVLFPHGATDWVQIYAVNANTHARSTFNLKSLYIPPYANNGCDGADAGQIQLWVKTVADQQWWFWSWINPGQTFVPGPGDGDGLDEIQITSPGSYPWKIDDVKLDVLF